MEFLIDGTAALATAPFQPIRTDPSRPAPLRGAEGPAPGDLGELVHRLEEVIRWFRAREAERAQGPVLRFGAVEVELATQTIRRAGARVEVTRTEFRLLYALLRRPGQVVGRDELLVEVWGPEVRHRSRAIDTHIARLRRKLEPDPAAPRHILTAPYRGYRLDPHGR